MATVDDLQSQLDQLPDPAPAATEFGPQPDITQQVRNQPAVNTDALLRLRQLLFGAGVGAGGGYTGATMSPGMMIAKSIAPYLGVKPPSPPSAPAITNSLLDTAGLPPELPGKRDLLGNVLVNVGAAAPSLGTSGVSVAPLLSTLGSGVGAGAAQTAAETYAPDSDMAQLLAPLAGGFLGGGMSLGGSTPASEAAERQGVTDALTAGDATGSVTLKGLQQSLKVFPGGAEASVAKAKSALNTNPAEGDIGTIPQRVQDITNIPGVPVPDRDALGVHIADATGDALDRYRDNLTQAKGAADSLLGNARVDISPIQSFGGTYGAAAAKSGLIMNPDTFSPTLDQLGSINKQADSANTVSLSGLMDKRTALGQIAFSRDPKGEYDVPATGQPGVRQLYGTVSDTVKQGAEAAAGPAGRQAVQDVDNMVQAFRQPAPGAPAGAATPASALKDYSNPGNAAGRLMSDIQGGDLTRLASLKSQLTPEEWQGVAGSVWQNLWQPKPGGDQNLVSPTTALTNWNKITPAAKDILWGPSAGPGGSVPSTPSWRDAMDDMATVAGGMANTERFGNPSGTARVGGLAAAGLLVLNQLATGNYRGAGATAGTVAGTYPAQALLQNPAVVRALTNQMAGGSGYWPTTAARLQGIAAQTPELRDAINDYVGRMTPYMGR